MIATTTRTIPIHRRNLAASTKRPSRSRTTPTMSRMTASPVMLQASYAPGKRSMGLTRRLGVVLNPPLDRGPLAMGARARSVGGAHADEVVHEHRGGARALTRGDDELLRTWGCGITRRVET